MHAKKGPQTYLGWGFRCKNQSNHQVAPMIENVSCIFLLISLLQPNLTSVDSDPELNLICQH